MNRAEVVFDAIKDWFGPHAAEKAKFTCITVSCKIDRRNLINEIYDAQMGLLYARHREATEWRQLHREAALVDHDCAVDDDGKPFDGEWEDEIAHWHEIAKLRAEKLFHLEDQAAANGITGVQMKYLPDGQETRKEYAGP